MENNDYIEFRVNFLRETGPISLLHTIDYMQFGRWAGGVNNVLGAPGVHLFRSGLGCIFSI